MEEASENGKESSHSAHANEMNEWCIVLVVYKCLVYKYMKHATL